MKKEAITSLQSAVSKPSQAGPLAGSEDILPAPPQGPNPCVSDLVWFLMLKQVLFYQPHVNRLHKTHNPGSLFAL